MRKNLIRFVAVPGVVAVAGAAIGIAAASSATADTVTGGTMNITFSSAALGHFTIGQGLANPVAMGTATVAPGKVASKNSPGLLFSLPVTSGNANVAMDYGTVEADPNAALEIIDMKTGQAVTLNNIVFTVQDDTISAVPSDSPDASPVDFFDVNGQHVFGAGQPETFSGNSLALDPEGVNYLNNDLGTTLDPASTAKIGSFFTSFTSTNP